MEYYDENFNSLTSCTFEKKAQQIQSNRGLSREKSGDILKNLVKCAAPTIVKELSNNRKGAKLGRHLVHLSHTVYGTITEVCRDYANYKLILDSH